MGARPTGVFNFIAGLPQTHGKADQGNSNLLLFELFTLNPFPIDARYIVRAYIMNCALMTEHHQRPKNNQTRYKVCNSSRNNQSASINSSVDPPQA
jgi:hypothetical protein